MKTRRVNVLALAAGTPTRAADAFAFGKDKAAFAAFRRLDLQLFSESPQGLVDMLQMDVGLLFRKTERGSQLPNADRTFCFTQIADKLLPQGLGRPIAGHGLPLPLGYTQGLLPARYNRSHDRSSRRDRLALSMTGLPGPVISVCRLSSPGYE